MYRQAKIKDKSERLSIVVMTPLSSRFEKSLLLAAWTRSCLMTQLIHHKDIKPLKSLLKITNQLKW